MPGDPAPVRGQHLYRRHDPRLRPTWLAGNNAAFGTGPLTIWGGTLAASGAAITLANNVTMAGDFTLGGNKPLTLSGKVDLGAGLLRTLIITNNAKTTLSGVISGASGIGLYISNNSPDILTLSGANTYTGGTTLSSGRLAAGSSSGAGFGPFGTGTLTINGGILQASGSRTVSNAVVVNGNFSVYGLVNDNLTLTGNLALGTHYIANWGSGTTTLSGIISGPGGFYQKSAGTLLLSGANTYNGGIYIDNGTLVAGSNSVIAGGVTTSGPIGTGALTIWGGTLAASGAARTLANQAERLRQFRPGNRRGGHQSKPHAQRRRNPLLHTPTITVNNTTEIKGAIGQIGGSYGITKAGPGTLILSGANAYTGGTTVNAGTLVARGGDDRLPTTGTTTIARGATINLTNTNQTFANLKGAGTLSRHRT